MLPLATALDAAVGIRRHVAIQVASSAKRIAVLVDSIDSDHSKEVIAGVLRGVKSSRVRVVILAGGWLNGPAELPLARNFLYQALPKAQLDGIIVAESSLAQFCGTDPFRTWMKAFGHMPSVVIGSTLNDIPGVSVDGAHGIHEAVRHLVEVHGQRRIAFVRGPSAGYEAESRYQAYRAALLANDLVPDERLVVQLERLGWGDGIAAVTKLFDKRRFTPRTLEAVLCVNDEVARGVLEGMRKRSIFVPEQVSVVGFGNGPSARDANPPLTTVDQRAEQLAYLATLKMIAALGQGGSPASESLKTTLVVRSSCGCSTELENDSSQLNPLAPGMPLSCRLALLEQRPAIVAALSEASCGNLNNSPDWEPRLLDALLRDLTTTHTTHVVSEFENVARRHALDGGDIEVCHGVLTRLRAEVLRHGGSEPGIRPLLEDLLQESRLVLGRVGVTVEKSRHEALSMHIAAVARKCAALAGPNQLTDLAVNLNEQLPAVGIPEFTISRCCDQEFLSSGFEVVARRSRRHWHNQTNTVSAEDLGIDDALAEEDAVVVEPLEMGTVPLGIAAFTWGADVPEHYELLREALSGALRMTQLRER